MIQGGMFQLNGEVETRRAKKLFAGDTVSFMKDDGDRKTTSLDVSQEVAAKNYVYKPKVKKIKPVAALDENGVPEFGGRHRSEEWRKERKAKKLERKTKNHDNKS